MMKTFLPLGIILIAASLVGQNKNTVPEMLLFRGGDLNFNIAFGFSTWGGGTGSGTAGGVISPSMRNGAASIFFNPAELAQLTKPQLVFDTRPALGTETFSLQGSEVVGADNIRKYTDTFLRDTSAFKYTGRGTTYTSIHNARVNQSGQFSSFSLAMPVMQDWVVGIGYSYPIFSSATVQGNGIDVRIRNSENVGGNKTTFDMLLNTQIALEFALRMNVLTFGLGGKVYSGQHGELFFGASVSHSTVEQVSNLNLRMDGSITLNGTQEYFFNAADPNLNKTAGETNDFYWNIQGRYRDTKYGSTVGLYYKLPSTSEGWRFVNFSLVWELKPQFILTDENAVNVGYQPKFFKGSPRSKGNERLELLVDSLNLSKPNLTVPTTNPFAENVEFFFPGSLTFGMDAKVGRYTIATNVVKYMSTLHYKYASYEFGKTPSFGVKFALDVELPQELQGWTYALLPLRIIFLDLDGIVFQIFQSQTRYSNSHYRIGGGIMFGKGIAAGFPASSIESTRSSLGTPFPTGFSLGRQYSIYDHWTIGMMVFGLPDLATRISIAYEL